MINFLRRIAAASDNAFFYSLDIRAKKNCKSLIPLQALCKVNHVGSPTVGFSTSPNPASPSLAIVCGEVSESFVARVLTRLSEAEWKAPLGARDDIRVAWITVLKADEGHPTPFAQAFFQYFGVSPQKLIPFLAARADLDRIYAQHQAAWLEKYLPFRHHDGWRETFARIQDEIDAQALPPKKPAASVPADEVTRRAA